MARRQATGFSLSVSRAREYGSLPLLPPSFLVPVSSLARTFARPHGAVFSLSFSHSLVRSFVGSFAAPLRSASRGLSSTLPRTLLARPFSPRSRPLSPSCFPRPPYTSPVRRTGSSAASLSLAHPPRAGGCGGGSSSFASSSSRCCTANVARILREERPGHLVRDCLHSPHLNF